MRNSTYRLHQRDHHQTRRLKEDHNQHYNDLILLSSATSLIRRAFSYLWSGIRQVPIADSPQPATARSTRRPGRATGSRERPLAKLQTYATAWLCSTATLGRIESLTRRF